MAEKDFVIENGVLKSYKGRDGYVEIPSHVKTIGSNAFENCRSLISVIIPTSVKTIEYGAFRGCSSLENVEIPQSVTSIYMEVFFRIVCH